MNEIVRSDLLTLKAQLIHPEYVFKSDKVNKPLTWIKRSFAAACRDAGIENFTFHDLRHAACTRMGDAGVDVFTIAQVLGYSDLRLTARYTHATDRNLRGAVEKLPQYGQSEKSYHKIATGENRKAG